MEKGKKTAAGYRAKESLKMGTVRRTEREGHRKEATGNVAERVE